MTLLTDKERSGMLLRACETLLVHNVALRSLLQEAKVVDWPRKLGMTLSSDLASQTRAAFRASYSQCLGENAQEKLKVFLQNLAYSGPIQ